MGNWNIHRLIFRGSVSLFQFPIKPKICRKWLEKYYPKDKLNKSTGKICLIYSSMAQFNDSIKILWRNLNIYDVMHINLHISLMPKRFFRSFDLHSDKTVTLSELLLNINNFSNKIVEVIRKSHEFSFKIVRVITIVVSNPVNFLPNTLLWRQSIASRYSMTSRFTAILLLSPPSYIIYTLVTGIVTWPLQLT